MGNAIHFTVTTGEVIRHRVAGLHELIEIGSTTVTDVFEPRKEGLERVSKDRTIPNIRITLSKDPLATDQPGYQAPPAEKDIQAPRERRPMAEGETRESTRPEYHAGGAPPREHRGGPRGGGPRRGGRRFNRFPPSGAPAEPSH